MSGEAALARMLGQARTRRSGFAATAPLEWDAVTAAAELAVQLGHLAQCIARRNGLDVSGFDDPARPITDLGDELADVTLAVLSTAILAGEEPSAQPATPCGPFQTGGGTTADTGLLLVLVITAGRLAESAMVACGYRHRPAGDVPAVAGAAGGALAAVGDLAAATGVDLVTAFDAMNADATRFLAARAGDDPA
jgi:NTP pyrophosphatase (non-canonical NTP hydrolase)